MPCLLFLKLKTLVYENEHHLAAAFHVARLVLSSPVMLHSHSYTSFSMQLVAVLDADIRMGDFCFFKLEARAFLRCCSVMVWKASGFSVMCTNSPSIISMHLRKRSVDNTDV